MAKKAKSADKPKAPKLPKTIAGVKIPKDARKTANKALKAASSPAGRELIAAGLSMAVATAAARTRAARKTEEKVADTAGRAAAAGAHDMQALAETVGSIAASALEKLFAKKA